jgi:hypothetical protein
MQDPINTPQDFFKRVVTFDVEALNKNPEDVRLAFHAAISLHQISEWIWKAGLTPYKDLSQFRCALYQRCPSLKTVRDLASNAKHFPPDANRAGTMNVGISEGPIISVPNTFPFGEETQVQVLARYEQGEGLWVIQVIANAYDFWVEEMKRYSS